jgi:hypothetical protein
MALSLCTEIIGAIKGGYQKDMRDFHTLITDVLLKSLSPDLVRRCIAIRIAYDITCLSRGFVLDCWTVGAGALVSSAANLKTILASPVYNPETKLCEMGDPSSATHLEVIVELLVLPFANIVKSVGCQVDWC